MLRWLVVGLLLCNLAYFFWTGKSVAPGQSAAVSVEGAALKLLTEQTGKGREGNTVPARVPAPSPVCHMIGPFKEKISARQIKDRLKALDVEVKTYQLQIPEKPDYWVHLGPMRSRKEALDVLRELQGKK